MSVVDVVTVRLRFATQERLHPAPHLLRGAIASRFPDAPLMHQHDGDRLLYRYPQVQYRWDEEGPMIVGLHEGARFLVGVEWCGLTLRLGDREATVSEAQCAFRRHEVRMSKTLKRYTFAAPWLPLSQDNYARYVSLPWDGRVAELDRLAVAGLLLALRGVGFEVPGQLYAAFESMRQVECPYKGVRLTGFLGQLLTNAELPEGLALGRAISHGYGWVLPSGGTGRVES
jgi:hypothetical protein